MDIMLVKCRVKRGSRVVAYLLATFLKCFLSSVVAVCFVGVVVHRGAEPPAPDSPMARLLQLGACLPNSLAKPWPPSNRAAHLSAPVQRSLFSLQKLSLYTAELSGTWLRQWGQRPSSIIGGQQGSKSPNRKVRIVRRTEHRLKRTLQRTTRSSIFLFTFFVSAGLS